MNVLVIINGAAVAVQRVSAPKTLVKRDGVELRVFLMGDAVVAAIEARVRTYRRATTTWIGWCARWAAAVRSAAVAHAWTRAGSAMRS